MIKKVILFLFIISSGVVIGQELKVTTNFESGSARVLLLDQQTQMIRITPAGDPKRGIPNWWYVRIDGINTAIPLVLEVEAREDLIPDENTGVGKKTSPAFTWPTQAALSLDGKTWKQTAAGEKINNRMVYQVQPTAGTIWLAWGPPFTPTDALHFVNRISQTHSFAKAFTLGRSRAGREVPALQIAEGSKLTDQRPAIWISARHHAWECGGSWVGAGLVEWLVSDDAQAKWLRQHAEIFVVPLLDVDHVATGDGGKHSEPQDHNLDRSATPHWPEVAATQQRILALAAAGRMNLFLDLHNPSPGNKQQTAYVIEKAYMPEKAEPRKLRFVELMVEVFGGLKQNPARPPAENPALFHRVSVPWVLEHGNANTIAFCIETPWNTPAGTPEGYGIVGRKLGSAIEKLLREEEKQ
jgi:hypothetical protein